VRAAEEPVRLRWPSSAALAATAVHAALPVLGGRPVAAYGLALHAGLVVAIWFVWRRLRPRWGSPLTGAIGFGLLPWPAVTDAGLTPLSTVALAVPIVLGAGTAAVVAKRPGSRAVAALVWAAACAGTVLAARSLGLDPGAWAAYAVAAGIAGPLAESALAAADRLGGSARTAVALGCAAFALLAAVAWMLTL